MNLSWSGPAQRGSSAVGRRNARGTSRCLTTVAQPKPG
jgi:hypothetical protein